MKLSLLNNICTSQMQAKFQIFDQLMPSPRPNGLPIRLIIL